MAAKRTVGFVNFLSEAEKEGAMELARREGTNFSTMVRWLLIQARRGEIKVRPGRSDHYQQAVQ